MLDFLTGFLKIKRGETRLVLWLGIAIFASEGGYWLGGNAVDGLLFSDYPATQSLPYVLILKGLFAFVAIWLYSIWAERVNKRTMLTITTSAILVLLVGSWLILNFNPPSIFYFFLWPTTYTIPDLLSVQMWAIAAAIFDSRQSKRLFPLLNAGGTVGAVMGNFLTAPAANWLHSKNLMLVWAILAVLSYAMMRLAQNRLPVSKPKPNRTNEEIKVSFWQNLRVSFTVMRYYSIIGWLALGTTLVYLIYWISWLPYIKVSTDAYPNNADALAGFLGLVSGAAVTVSFLLSLFVVNRLFSRFGVRNMLLVMPITNLIGFLLMSLNFSFAPVIFARFSQLTVFLGVRGAADPTLYNLVPGEVQETARGFIQGFCQQLAFVLAGLCMLLGAALGIPVVLWIGLVLCVIYLYVSWRERNLYRTALVQLLRQGQQEFFDQQGENEAVFGVNIDDDAVHVAISGLRDNAEGTRRLSAELLGKLGAPEGVAPLLKVLISDSSPEVRRAAIISLTELGSPEVMMNIANALQDPDPGVRASAAAGLHHFKANIDQQSLFYLEQALLDNSPSVRKEAVVSLAALGRGGEALVTLWEMGRSEDSQARREAASGYGTLREPLLTGEVIKLLEDSDPQVRKTAAASLGLIGSNEAMAALFSHLDDNNEAVREEVAAALARLQPRSFMPLHRYLTNNYSDIGQMTALRSLSLARLRQLHLDDFVETEHDFFSLDSNAADSSADIDLSTANSNLEIAVDAGVEENLLRNYAQTQLNIASRYLTYLKELRLLSGRLQEEFWSGNIAEVRDTEARRKLRLRPYRNPQNLTLLVKSLEMRYRAAVQRLITVVGLLSDVEASQLIVSALSKNSSPRVVADAIETLENTGDARLTPAVVALLEERLPQAIEKPPHGNTLAESLQNIWNENDEWLRACVLHIIGLFDLTKLRPLVERTLLNPGVTEESLLADAATEAQQRLDWPRDDRELERSLIFVQTLSTLSVMSRILFLQKVGIFNNLSPEDLRRVARVSKERIFAPNEIICYEGDPGDELYIVVSGKIQVITGYGTPNAANSISGATGRTLAVRGEGDVLGEMALLDDIPRSATLRAYSGPVRLLTLGGDEFKQIMRERPELAIGIIRTLSRLLRETNQRMQETTETVMSEVAVN